MLSQSIRRGVQIQAARGLGIRQISLAARIPASSTRTGITSRSTGITLLPASAKIRAMQIRLLSASYPDHYTLKMPALSPTMTEGEIAKWVKNVGDEVRTGEALAEIQTDKAVLAFDSTENGFLAKILVNSGEKDIPVGRLIAVLAENKEDVAKFADYTGEAPAATAAPAAVAAPAAPAPAAPAAAAQVTSSPHLAGKRLMASPAARRLAEERGIDLNTVQGTGPGRRVVKADILEYQAPVVAAPAAAAAPRAAPIVAHADGPYEDIPNTKMRQVIAERLTQSKQEIPHYYLTIDCNVDKLIKMRAQLNANLEKAAGKNKENAAKLSVNDFIVKASALALQKMPQVNASWIGSAIRQYGYVDISVAVSTDSGLITPIVKNADKKGLTTISSDVRDLAGKARAGKLQPHEYQGGTFTISNLGMYGVQSFSAIINPPQSCILAVGGTEQRVVAVPNAQPGEPAFAVANYMSVTLSCDHRVVDGALGAQWLSAFRGYIEDPLNMML